MKDQDEFGTYVPRSGRNSASTESLLTKLRTAHSLADGYQPVYGFEPQGAERKSRAKIRCELLEQWLPKNLFNIRILDVGCSMGYFSLHLADKGAQVTGIDCNVHNIVFCKTLAKVLGVPCEFRLGKMSLPLSDQIERDAYDVVLLFSVLHHVVCEYGINNTKAMLEAILHNTGEIYVELAQKEERVDYPWREQLPQDELVLFRDFGTVEKIGAYASPLDQITDRPIYRVTRRHKGVFAMGSVRKAPAGNSYSCGAPSVATLPLIRFSEPGNERRDLSREFQSRTGRLEPTGVGTAKAGVTKSHRLLCIPGAHAEGHCIFGGDYLIEEMAQYSVKFDLTVRPTVDGENTLVVLDVYENLQSKAVLAERRITHGDLKDEPSTFELEFFAEEGQCVEFRIYWGGQCELTVEGLSLERAPPSTSPF